ncbi:MAG TPA: hypothetical protein VKE74_28395 [Gemmataceae bacterium]|nr:hypothetical protein [Gemmataceae bacterium]
MGEPPPSTPAANGTPAAGPADPPAPADLVPPPSRQSRAAWYGGAVLLSALLAVFGHCVVRLDGFRFLPYPPFVQVEFNRLALRTADLRAPFVYDADTLLILPMAKAFVENGTHWRIDRMGCPGSPELTELGYAPCTELYDFPVIDYLHFIILWLLGRVFSDVVVVYNLYYLLTYPLTTLSAMAVLRQMRLTLPAAAVGGLLYAFIPYHYMRGEAHYFLAAYWVLPLSLLPLFGICRGDYPFFRPEPGGLRFRPFTWNALGQVAIAVATAAAGAYYAFFTCFLYAAAALYVGVTRREWRAAVSVGLVGVVVVGVGVVEHLPVYVHQAGQVKNPITSRTPEEAEGYGLKLAQLVLPIDNHNLTILSRLKARYNTVLRPVQNENESSSLGVVASAGLVILLVWFLFPGGRAWPYGPLAFLTGLVILFALVGGLGSLFNFFLYHQVRCYNRFSIVLAFFCLFAVLWPLDRFLVTRTGWARRLRYPVLVAVFGIGFLDQTPFPWFAERGAIQLREHAERFHADHRFFAEIESSMPEGARILSFPYIPYPEYHPMFGMWTYEHARGYLHTRSVLWGYGVMKNRAADMWYREVAAAQPFDLLNRVVYRGYDGVLIDKRGYGFVRHPDNPDLPINEGELLVQKLKESAAPAALREVVHEDREQVFLDLREYRDKLKAADPARFEEEARRERERPILMLLDGFHNYDPLYPDRAWWAKRTATAVLFNPSGRERVLELQITFAVAADGPFHFWLDAPELIDLRTGQPLVDDFPMERRPRGAGELPAQPHGEQRTYRLRVPPGLDRAWITFRCEYPSQYLPPDYRMSCYYISEFRVTEVPP